MTDYRRGLISCCEGGERIGEHADGCPLGEAAKKLREGRTVTDKPKPEPVWEDGVPWCAPSLPCRHNSRCTIDDTKAPGLHRECRPAIRELKAERDKYARALDAHVAVGPEAIDQVLRAEQAEVERDKLQRKLQRADPTMWSTLDDGYHAMKARAEKAEKTLHRVLEIEQRPPAASFGGQPDTVTRRPGERLIEEVDTMTRVAGEQRARAERAEAERDEAAADRNHWRDKFERRKLWQEAAELHFRKLADWSGYSKYQDVKTIELETLQFIAEGCLGMENRAAYLDTALQATRKERDEIGAERDEARAETAESLNAELVGALETIQFHSHKCRCDDCCDCTVVISGIARAALKKAGHHE